MARPAPERLAFEAYPFSERMTTRFQDLDPHDHINNVAMAGLFENGRVRFLRTLVHHRRDDQRWLVAAVAINYLEEATFPADIVVASGIGRIGERSWTILSAAFQNGVCVATCDTTLVISAPERGRAIDAALRAALEARMLHQSALSLTHRTLV